MTAAGSMAHFSPTAWNGSVHTLPAVFPDLYHSGCALYTEVAAGQQSPAAIASMASEKACIDGGIALSI